jgi:hypothetical protein
MKFYNCRFRRSSKAQGVNMILYAGFRGSFKTPPFAQSLRQAQILILEKLMVKPTSGVIRSFFSKRATV